MLCPLLRQPHAHAASLMLYNVALALKPRRMASAADRARRHRCAALKHKQIEARCRAGRNGMHRALNSEERRTPPSGLAPGACKHAPCCGHSRGASGGCAPRRSATPAVDELQGTTLHTPRLHSGGAPGRRGAHSDFGLPPPPASRRHLYSRPEQRIRAAPKRRRGR